MSTRHNPIPAQHDLDAPVTTSDAELAPYLPRLVRAWSLEPGRRARSIDGSLLSVDVSGFTALSERLATRGREGAEELVRTISDVFDVLIATAERHGGDVLKFRGDALLLLFRDDQHPARACGAAADMQGAIGSLGRRETSAGPVELRMACGVHSGAVQVFMTEVPHRELLVAGHAATRVFALEDLAEAGEIVVSAETAERVEPSWLAGARGDGLLLRALEPGSSPIPPPEAVEGHELAAYVPASLRDHLAVASGEAEHRQVTVAFVKATGTDAADDDPEAMSGTLDTLASAAATACERYGLTWLESDIDADAIKLYLTGGAPATTGHDEESMLRALRDVVESEIEGLTLRAGVNRGRVFTGDIGSRTRRTYAVMGDAVNLAARLVARARPGTILVTSEVLDRAWTAYATETEPLLVKGKEAAIMAHTLGSPTGTRRTAAVDVGPIVGRAAELEVVADAVQRARSRELQLLEVVAEPGMGKSRLISEARTLALGFQQLEAAGEPYTTNDPFAAVRGLLRQLLGITADASRADAGIQLSTFVGSALPDVAQWLPLLAMPFDAAVEGSLPESLDPATSYERLHDVLATLLERVLMMPTLIVVEDAHWLDDASRAFLTNLVARPAARPWVVLAASRPGAPSLGGEQSPLTRIELAPLDAEASSALALGASAAPLPETTVAALVARAGGNPLFVRALVLAAAAGEPVDALPETVESLLTTLIDTLAPADRMLLRHAAVVGPSFDASLVEEVLAEELDGASRWEALGQFVQPDGTGFRFRHDLVRVTAYEGLSFGRRREIHGRVGAALERRAGDGGEHDAAILSLHFHEAGLHEKAWRYATSAADRAAAGFANVVAAGLYERALASADAAGTVPADEIARVAEALGDVCERFADGERSAAAYERALRELTGEREGTARIGGSSPCSTSKRDATTWLSPGTTRPLPGSATSRSRTAHVPRSSSGAAVSSIGRRSTRSRSSGRTGRPPTRRRPATAARSRTPCICAGARSRTSDRTASPTSSARLRSSTNATTSSGMRGRSTTSACSGMPRGTGTRALRRTA